MRSDLGSMCMCLCLAACAGPATGSTDPASAGPVASRSEEAESHPSEPPVATGAIGTAPVSAAGHMVDGFYVEPGSPPPRTCAADADCVASGTVTDTGCCWSYRDMNATAQSRSYARWLADHRAACGDATCLPPPVPTEPPACLFAVRCDTERSVCMNGC